MRLLTNATAGNGATVAKAQFGNRELDQLVTIYIWGTFGGTTVSIEISFDGTEWFNTGIAATAKGVFNLEFRAPYMRGVVTGGAAMSIQALAM